MSVSVVVLCDILFLWLLVQVVLRVNLRAAEEVVVVDLLLFNNYPTHFKYSLLPPAAPGIGGGGGGGGGGGAGILAP